MKQIIKISFCLMILFDLSGQKNLEFSHYSYRAYTKSNDWHWLSASYNIKLNYLSYGLGIGYNLTPLFINENIYLNAIPKNKNFINNFNLNCVVRKHFDLKKENIDIFIFNKLNLNHTSFLTTELSYIDSVYYMKQTYSSPQFLIDNTLGIGLDVLIYNNFHFFTRAGIVFHYRQNEIIGNNSFNINEEFGIKFDFKKKPKT